MAAFGETGDSFEMTLPRAHPPSDAALSVASGKFSIHLGSIFNGLASGSVGLAAG